MLNKRLNNKKPGSSNYYRDAGVDLDKAGRAINLIKDSVYSTFSKNVISDLTSFSGLYRFNKDKFDEPVLVSSTDGVGTKLILARETGMYGFIGQDLVGMCINDILCCGATPLFFLDYIACGKISLDSIKVIVESISRSCKFCSTALIGGEIAEMPGMYLKGDIDIAGFTVGVVEKEKIIRPGMVSIGDIVMGIPSSGIHSNGFSLVRKIIADKKLSLDREYEIKGKIYQHKNLGDILLTPTRLYYRILEKIKSINIKLNGIAHITGGGFFENINRIIPDDMDVEIETGSWKIPGIFQFLQDNGDIEDKEMFRVFNMGIGMVIITDILGKKKIKSAFAGSDEKIIEIGTVKEGNGKVILR